MTILGKSSKKKTGKGGQADCISAKYSFRRLLETHDIHGFSCLGTVKQAIKTHQKCIFQPLHIEVKSVLGINESYSMGKKS